MSRRADINIALPEQTRQSHSLFALSNQGVAKWINGLPRAHIGETTRLLYLALTELNTVVCPERDRLDILDTIRPSVHYAIKGLEKHFLNQPIFLPDKAKQTALLADTLNRQLAIGYTLALSDMIANDKPWHAKDQLGMALHRAISEFSVILLRHSQLYRDVEEGLWRILHQLFYQVLSHKLGSLRIEDQALGSCNLEQAYLRALMFAAARPHQLNQRNQEQVFLHLAEWGKLLKLRGENHKDCVFVFNPVLDKAPIYQELAPASQGWLGIETEPLCRHLQNLLDNKGKSATNSEKDLSHGLIAHLRGAWSTMLQRKAVRVDREEVMYLSLGIFSTHFFVAEGRPFGNFTRTDETATGGNSPLQTKKSGNVWEDFQGFDRFEKEQTDPEELLIEAIHYEPAGNEGGHHSHQSYRYYDVRLINSSERGYCIAWPSREAVHLQTGEVVGVREEDAQHWSVGAIRWIKQLEDGSSQVGIEVISAAAEPYSARVVHAGLAVGEHQRALVLDRDPATDTPHRLMLQKSRFEPGQTLELLRPGAALRVLLTERAPATGKFALFEYKTLKQFEPDKPLIKQQSEEKAKAAAESPEHDDKEFGTLWDLL